MIEIALAQEADIAEIMQVLRQCTQHLKDQGLDQWDDVRSPEYAHVQWTTNGTPVLVVHRLAVAPQWQRRGIGRKLMRFAERFAVAHGYGAIRLDTAMEPAKCLHRSLGFVEIPPYEDVPLADVAFMELPLT